MIRVALVSYLNTLPYQEGFKRCFLDKEYELIPLPPADCAERLKSGECDLALIPVGSLADFDQLDILNHYCIGADGDVHSVFLLSNDPPEKLNKVFLDPHSRTSNGLIKILFKRYWNKEVVFLENSNRDFSKLKEGEGMVSIGDVAFNLSHQFKYVQDLSGIWKKMTSFPFVFAVWACNSGKFSSEEIEKLEETFATGISTIPEMAGKWGPDFGYSPIEALNYLSNSIVFSLSKEMHSSLELYLEEKEMAEKEFPTLSPNSAQQV